MSHLTEYLNEFLNYLTTEKGCSQQTIRAYGYEIKYLANFIPDKPIKKLTVRDIRNGLFLLSRPPNERKEEAELPHNGRECANQTRTIARKINSLRSYFKFLFENDIILINPMAKIHNPRLPKNKASVPSPEVFDKIIDYYQNHFNPRIEKHNTNIFNLQAMQNPETLTKRLAFIEHHQKERDKLIKQRNYGTLILRFLYGTMARSIELIRLRVIDIDFNARIIKLHGKGNKERFVPLDDDTLHLLSDHIQLNHFKADDHVFRNRDNHELHTINSILSRIRTIRKNLGVEYKLTAHFFRKAGLSHLSWAGVSLTDLQDLAGHASPETTRIYVVSNPDLIRKDYSKHPLNNKPKTV